MTVKLSKISTLPIRKIWNNCNFNEINALRIDNSEAAPFFKIVSQPNNYLNINKQNDKDLSNIQKLRYEFWSKMNENFENSCVNFNLRKPTYDHWYDIALGSSKYNLTIHLLGNLGKIRVGLWIRDDKIFEKIKQVIELYRQSFTKLLKG
jgi:hypothetical protein